LAVTTDELVRANRLWHSIQLTEERLAAYRAHGGHVRISILNDDPSSFGYEIEFGMESVGYAIIEALEGRLAMYYHELASLGVTP
jgi:hypothetical protein